MLIFLKDRCILDLMKIREDKKVLFKKLKEKYKGFLKILNDNIDINN
jgi:hypothetical protein